MTTALPRLLQTTTILRTHHCSQFQALEINMSTPTINSDSSLGPVYFWREFEEPYGFLSQWYESAFEVDGVTYVSAEMWMMVQKAKLFGDEVYRL